MKKKITLLLVLSLIVSLLAGCGGGAAKADSAKADAGGDDEYFVGALYDSLQVESRVRQKNELESYAKELGMKLVFQDAALDEKKQMEQAESLIAQGVDAIIILAHNAEAMTALPKMCKDAGVTLIVTDRMIEGDYDYFVGLDNDAVGYTQATYAVEHCPKGNYILIAGAPTDPNAIQWIGIWDEILKPYVDSGDINIVFEELTADWDATIAASNTENALTLCNDDCQVVLAMADCLANGVVQALDQRGLAGKVLVTGLDGEAAAFQRIAEGTQTMTMLIDDVKVVRAMLDLLDAVRKKDDAAIKGMLTGKIDTGKGTEVDAIIIPYIPIDADNLYEYVKLGYADYDFTYQNVPEDQRPEKP